MLELDPSRIRNWQVGRAKAATNVLHGQQHQQQQQQGNTDVSQASYSDDYRVSPPLLPVRSVRLGRFIFVVVAG